MTDDTQAHLHSARARGEYLATQGANMGLGEQLNALDDPIKAAAMTRASLRSLPHNTPFNGREPGNWRDAADKVTGLPPGCPVVPLGREGGSFWYLSADGTLSALTARASAKRDLMALFAPCNSFLKWAWPRWDAKKQMFSDNFEADHAADDLFSAASLKGAWSSIDQVRGKGCWQHKDGSLIVHLGDQLWHGKLLSPPGEYKGYVYPVRPVIVPPVRKGMAPAGKGGTGEAILDAILRWNWTRKQGNLDARLMLGWLAHAAVAGALDWRASVLLTGDIATGKSTLQKLVEFVLAGALVKAADTTAAGIYQNIKTDSLPVSVDEFENKSDPRKAIAVVELARLASSGGLMLRGGSDHNAAQFVARSAFLFSCVNPPPLQPSDRSRMAMLCLRPLEARSSDAVLDADEMTQLGRELFRRAIDWWPRLYQLEDGSQGLLPTFRRAMMDPVCGHVDRGADQFGTLAAFAHLAIYDDMPTPEQLGEWQTLLKAEEMEEVMDIKTNWRNCFDHILTTNPRMLQQATYKNVGDMLLNWKGGALSTKALRQQLAKVGLSASFEAGVPEIWSNLRLFVPMANATLGELFLDTVWTGGGGAGGTWGFALGQGPHEFISKGKGRVGLIECRGIYVRAGEILGDVDVSDVEVKGDG